MGMYKAYNIKATVNVTMDSQSKKIENANNFTYECEALHAINSCFNDWTNNLVNDGNGDVMFAQSLIPYGSYTAGGNSLYVASLAYYSNDRFTIFPYLCQEYQNIDISTNTTTSTNRATIMNSVNRNINLPRYVIKKEFSSSGLQTISDMCMYIKVAPYPQNKTSTFHVMNDDMCTVKNYTSVYALENQAGAELFIISDASSAISFFNDKDGTYSSTNSRMELKAEGTEKNCCPCMKFTARLHDNNILSSYTSSIPLLRLLDNPLNTSIASEQIQYKAFINNTIETSSMKIYSTFPEYLVKHRLMDKDTAFHGTTVAPLVTDSKSKQIANAGTNSYCLYTKQSLVNFFALFGVKVTFSLDEAKYKNTDEWEYQPNYEYIPPNTGGGEDPENPEGGGDGTVDNKTDIIEEGDLSTGTSELSASYLINYTQLKLLQDNFNDATKWTDISRWFYEPSSAVINIVRFPFDISRFQPSSQVTAQNISIMGRELTQDGVTINGYLLGKDAITRIPMGSISIPEYYGSFLDYDPYTKISIYLPYFGFYTISAMNVVGKTLKLWYNIAYTDGSAVAVLESDETPIYIYKSQIGYIVPMCKTDALQKQQDRVMSVISGATSMLSSGASGAASAVASGASGGGSGVDTGSMVAMGQTAINTASSLLTKTSVIASGVTEGQHARALTNKPYLIIERPVTAMPSNYGAIKGYQCNLYGKLNTFKGFTVCDNIKLDGVFAYESEKDKIKQLLMQGVIL